VNSRNYKGKSISGGQIQLLLWVWGPEIIAHNVMFDDTLLIEVDESKPVLKFHFG
jgi:hypothetical protein